MGKELRLPCDVGEVSDGFHTFNELYDHRQVLFAALMNALSPVIVGWKSKLHHDGSSLGPLWFIAGIDFPGGTVTYHVNMRYWGLFKCHERERAPEWDGHTSEDVLNRLMEWIAV